MTWRTDSRLESYAAVRSGKDAWNETHAFGYNGRHQLVSEARSGTGGALTLTHSHDQAGLGVRVAMIESGSLDNGWVAAPQSTQIPTLDQFGRVADERIAASIFKLRAHGTASGVSGLTAKLDNTVVSGLAYDVAGTESTWWVDLSLDPGTYVLKVEGKDRLNRPVTKQSSFSLAGDRSIHTDFLGGHVSQRTETGGNGERQEFIWDARGRLLSVMTHTADPQEPVRGFHAVYDAMGRRLRTIDADHIYGIRSSLAFDTHVYDPQTEFLEIGLVRGFLDLASPQPQGYNRHRANSWHWMVYGPDDAGRQGGMQGLGGLEASFEVSAAGLSLTPPQSPVWTAVVTDHFGHTLATVKGGQTAWNPTRVDGYGAVQGYRAPVSIEASYLSFFPKPDRVAPLEATLWRGKRIDPTGYYWIGARYYDPVGGRFLSPDPLGHAATWDLYSFANGDPINYYDPDGRLARDFYHNGLAGAQMLRSGADYLDAYASGSENAWLGSAADFGSSMMGSLAEMGTPENYVNGIGTTLHNTGTIYDRAISQDAGWGQASYEAGAYLIGGVVGMTPLYEGINSIDLAAGSELNSVDSWSRGLTGGGSLLLAGTGGAQMVTALRPGAAWLDDVMPDVKFAAAEGPGGFNAAKGGEDAIRLFHGTTANRGSKIVANGFRPGGDGAVFLAEESSTAFHFGREAAAGTGARSINALEFTVPRSVAEDLGLMNRQVLGEFRGARPLDVPGGSGYERIMTGGNIDAFNQALRDGTITVRRLRGGF